MTTKNNSTDIYEEFRAIMQTGDEQAARAFLTDNFARFPENVQEEITMAFFEESILQKAGGIEKIASLQAEGIETLTELSKEKKALEDTASVHRIKKDLGL